MDEAAEHLLLQYMWIIDVNAKDNNNLTLLILPGLYFPYNLDINQLLI